VEVQNLAAQLTESQKVEDFSKDFFSLLGDLSSSFNEHLQEVVEKSDLRHQGQKDESLKASVKETLSGKQEHFVEVKISDPKAEKETLKIEVNNNKKKAELPPEEVQQQILAQNQKAPVIKQNKLPIRETAQNSTSKAPTDPSPKQSNLNAPLNSSTKATETKAPIVAKKAPEEEVKEPVKKEEQAPLSKKIVSTQEQKLPPIKISKESSAKLSKDLQEIANKTAVQAPNIQNLSQHIISSLKASNSPLIKAAESSQNNQISNFNSNEKTIVKKEAPPPNTDAKKAQHGEQMQKIKETIVKQVRMHLKLLLREGTNEIQIKLKPAFLGNLKISIGMEDESKISQLTFHVQNESAKELIQNNLHQLKEALDDKDISLASVEVETEDSTSNFADQQAHKEQDLDQAKKWISSFQTLKIEGNPEVEEIIEEDPLETEDPDQIINIVV
jgi:flagellar hook-length control protein FliK